jgi:DNA-binding NtrC family response regulator
MPPRPIVRHTSTGAGVTAERQRVLLLDPDPGAAHVMASQLRHAGFDTHITTSGPSALLATRTMHFGAIVVVADLSNPESCRYLREIRRSALRAWHEVGTAKREYERVGRSDRHLIGRTGGCRSSPGEFALAR